MYGGDTDGVIAEMRDLTGRVPMFPLWTYGYGKVRNVIKIKRKPLVLARNIMNGVPIDGVIQDWQYWK